MIEINKSLKINKKYSAAYYSSTTIYLDLGDDSNACKDFKKALAAGIEKDPHFEVDEDFEKLKSLGR